MSLPCDEQSHRGADVRRQIQCTLVQRLHSGTGPVKHERKAEIELNAIEPRVATRRVLVTRDLLYEAAAALFVERGYDSTTMSDIAERAGTSRRTAFNHFPSKGDIPMLWTRRRADRVVAMIAESAVTDALDQTRDYFRLLSEMTTQDPELSRQMIVGWTAALGPLLHESQLLCDLVAFLEKAQGQGRIDEAVDIALAARTLNDVYQGAVMRWVREQDAADPLPMAVSRGIELVLSAIRSHP
jgi:AcrR family transcriptional regulator